MFERYVADVRPDWKRRAVVISSIVLHGMFAVSVVVASLLVVDEIAPPPIPLRFFESAPMPPPPLPPALGSHKTKPDHVHVVHKIRPKLVQPDEIKPPEPPPPPDPADEPEGEADGVEGGAKDGVVGGTLAGVEGGQLGGQALSPPEAAPRPPPPPPRLVASFVFDRERINYPDPHLPMAFIESHAHQILKGLYKICVDTGGRISSMTVVTSLGGADETIIAQVQSSWLYKAQPGPVCTPRVFEFRIN